LGRLLRADGLAGTFLVDQIDQRGFVLVLDRVEDRLLAKTLDVSDLGLH